MITLSRMLLAALFWIACGCSAMDNSTDGGAADWVQVQADELFSVMAPPGTRWQARDGKDSAAGRFETPAFTLAYDYGFYSNPLNDASHAERYATRDLVIDGRKAKTVSYYAPGHSAARPYFIGIHFPNVKPSAQGSIRLTVYASVAAAEDYDQIIRIFESIRFK